MFVTRCFTSGRRILSRTRNERENAGCFSIKEEPRALKMLSSGLVCRFLSHSLENMVRDRMKKPEVRPRRRRFHRMFRVRRMSEERISTARHLRVSLAHYNVVVVNSWRVPDTLDPGVVGDDARLLSRNSSWRAPSRWLARNPTVCSQFSSGSFAQSRLDDRFMKLRE